jgi:hypothetical protein
MRNRFLAAVAVLMTLVLSLAPLAAQAARPNAVSVPVPVVLGAGGAAAGDVSVQGTIGGSANTPGTIWIGATPPNVSYSKPVLVFVPGKGSPASSWWTDTVYHGTNDMYTYAYNNGYRTAFVDLYTAGSMWANGEMLRGQIDQIAAYFGVAKVTLVAHSKGGVDANAASVHYGASPRISRVITLGTPHWGTPVADLAYSTWTWWLAALLGERNDATYVMQTGYMDYFRSITDGRDPTVPYYTLSGYKCGPVFTALWMGCAAISGEDDGLVPVWSARKPGGTHLKEGYWDHDEIRMGSRTWNWFVPQIQTAATGSGAVAAAGPLLAAAPGRQSDVGAGSGASGKPGAPGNLILRGGSTAEPTPAAFPLEAGVRSVTFTFLASGPDFTGTLVGPDGSSIAVAATGQVAAGEVFAGAWIGTAEVNNPAAGSWSLKAAAPGATGYLLVATLESDLQATLDAGRGVATPGAGRALTVAATAQGRVISGLKAEAAVSLSGQQPHGRPAFAAGAGGQLVATVAVPAGSGIHNVTVNLTGTLPDGTAFERTLFTSFAAVAPGDWGSWR